MISLTMIVYKISEEGALFNEEAKWRYNYKATNEVQTPR